MFVGGHRSCWRVCAPKVVSICLNCEILETGPQTEDHPGQMRIVRLWAAELIVGGRRRRPLRQVLQLTAAALVSEDDVELSIGSEGDHAAVMVSARRLALVALVRGLGCPVVLERSEHHQVAVERQRRPVPDESVDAVPEQRDLEDVVRVRTEHVHGRAPLLVRDERIRRRGCAPAGPVEVDPGVRGEVGV
jgi:hypothetical protein